MAEEAYISVPLQVRLHHHRCRLSSLQPSRNQLMAQYLKMPRLHIHHRRIRKEPVHPKPIPLLAQSPVTHMRNRTLRSDIHSHRRLDSFIHSRTSSGPARTYQRTLRGERCANTLVPGKRAYGSSVLGILIPRSNIISQPVASSVITPIVASNQTNNHAMLESIHDLSPFGVSRENSFKPYPGAK
ncbi:hypothetical protein BDZ89DRAFT_692384 [Hymenopellis radicata]|nr:hypothetical protein BDZ89DRAFT_692384 [Hymenopellis radicata]